MGIAVLASPSRRRSSSSSMTKPFEKPQPLVVDASKKSLKAATGTESVDLQRRLAHQVVEALWLPSGLSKEERTRRMKAVLAALEEINPQDGVEGMLAAQMVATHNAALECLRRAAIPDQTPECLDMSFRHAEKLMASYLRQLEALGKHRSKGTQTMTVKYVNVESGGQAVVGSVHTGQLPVRDTTEISAPVKALAHPVIEPLAVDHQPGAVPWWRQGSPDE
jgi:hypothetical protein